MSRDKWISFSGGKWQEESECYCYEPQGFLFAAIGESEAEAFLKDSELEGDAVQGVWDVAWLERKQAFLRELDCHFLLVIWEEHEEKCILFFSDTKRVRSLEFLDYLLPEFGMVRGDASCALGRINDVILKLLVSQQGEERVEYYLQEKIVSYFTDSEWIDAQSYDDSHAEEIKAMESFQKKKIPWAYVKTTDITSAGREMAIKSLENESGLTVKADENTYIMIGCRGEVYDIKREKFESTYEKTEEGLDVFERMMDFIPEVVILKGQEYVSLDEYAHLCYPKAGAGIYARKLERRTKVFPADGSEEYYLGKPGDYLAIRREDSKDIYIIQGDIFLQTYEPSLS
jgi:phosphoglycolate phosphatase